MKKRIKITVNGVIHQLVVDPRKTLLDLLRNDLRLTGTKKGCNEGECGSCTVLLNNKPVNSCLVLAVRVDGQHVLTIEGLSKNGLHPIQEAFIEYGAVQCGFCTPGMILSAKALLDENRTPSEMEVGEAISGNLCRCTGYQKIVSAILSMSKGMRQK